MANPMDWLWRGFRAPITLMGSRVASPVGSVLPSLCVCVLSAHWTTAARWHSPILRIRADLLPLREREGSLPKEEEISGQACGPEWPHGPLQERGDKGEVSLGKPSWRSAPCLKMLLQLCHDTKAHSWFQAVVLSLAEEIFFLTQSLLPSNAVSYSCLRLCLSSYPWTDQSYCW